MKPPGATRLTVRPITQKQANAWVDERHRHHKAPRGGAFCLQALDPDGKTRGIAIAGRPVSRNLDDGTTLEILRVATDGHPNACSFLYAAVRRVAQAMGYTRILTYTLPEEGGASLRGAGFDLDGTAGGGQWSRPSRPRNAARHPTQQKLRWRTS